MTIRRTNNTLPARERWATSHGQSRCPQKLKDSFWLPSDCPNGLNAVWPLDALVDATEVTWHGGRYATARYECACCGATWVVNDWPVVMALGPGWRRRYEPPVHLVAGESGIPRRTAAEVYAHIQALRLRAG